MAIVLDGTTGITTPSLSGPLNGTVGATTPAAGAFTTLNATGNGTIATLTGTGVTSYLKMTNTGQSSANGFQVQTVNEDVYVVNYSTAGNIFFSTNGSANNDMAINAAGGVQHINSISVGNATPSVSGAGITFPATQSASSDANTLDDYEEGTWTPQPTFGGGTTGMTFSVQSGSYTKIGRSVFISARITFTNKGSATGGFFISSLPFATASGNAFYSGASIAYVDGVANASTWTVQQTIILDAGQTYMLFRYINGSGTSTNHTNSDVGNSLDIIVTATYQSA